MPELEEQIREFIDSGAMPVTAAEVIAAQGLSESMSPGGISRYRRPRQMRSYAMGAVAMATAICVLVVVLVFGVSSSNPSAVTPTRPAGVPASWQKVTFGGLTMYAPGNWPSTNEETWEDCSTASQPLFKASSVVLDTGAGPSEPPASCPAIRSQSSIPPVYGLVIDPGKYGPLKDVMPIDPGFAPGVTGFDKCLLIHGLSVCPTSVNFGGILIVAVHIPGITRPVAVEIGHAGGGKVAHTILYSMRQSATLSTTSPTSPRGFVALAERGADGTFMATYDIPAQRGNGASTVTVAHQAPPGSTSPKSGSWMFAVDRIASGARYLWVAHPQGTDVCEKVSASASWSCEQTTLTGGGNGWLLTTALYLPLTELYGIQNSVQGDNPSSVTTTNEKVAGIPVECLSLIEENNEAHLQWCITSSGVLASFSAMPQADGDEFGDSPADGILISVSSTVPATAFSLPATPGAWKGPLDPPR